MVVGARVDHFGGARFGIAATRGPIKAVVGLEHTILTALSNMLRTGEPCLDLAVDNFTNLLYRKAVSLVAVLDEPGPRCRVEGRPSRFRYLKGGVLHRWRLAYKPDQCYFSTIT